MNSFQETGLRPEIVQAVEDLGFETPTLIQSKAIPQLLDSNQDIIGFAHTGTGKTAAFGLPLLHNVNPEEKTIQGLILCPTRELCLQISRDLDAFSKYIKGVKVTAVYGGAPIDKQIQEIKRRPQIIVGTPGRVIDLLERGILKVENIVTLVLDEADEMMTMGFKEELNTILSFTPKEKQTVLFSATMAPEIYKMARTYMNEFVEISAGGKNTSSETVEHWYYMVNARDKYEALKRIADLHPEIYGIVFCRTRKETKEVADKLMQDGYSADSLHGDLSQAQRDHVMGKFRLKHLQILVATDVAARGLDVNELSHVIHFSLPDDPEVYLHRSGRTGRAGKEGVSIALAHQRDNSKLRLITQKMKVNLQKQTLPSGSDICEQQLFNLIDKVKDVTIDSEQIEPYLTTIYEKLSELEREELIQKFVSIEFNRFLSYYKNARDLNVKDRDDRGGRDRGDRGGRDRGGRDRGERGGRDRGGRERGGRERGGRDRGDRGSFSKNENMSRFFINIGKFDQVNKRTVLELINEAFPKQSIDVGQIEILDKFSFFEVEDKFEKQVPDAFQSMKYNGRKLNVEFAKSK